MAVDANSPFLWGSGGRRLTPEEILLERKDANALGQQAMATTPVGHWSAGLSRVLQGLMSGYDDSVATSASNKNAAESSSVIQALLSGGATPAASPITAPAASGVAPVSTPMGNTSIPAGKSEFISSIAPMVQEAAAKTGLDPRLIIAQAGLESGWGQHAPGNNLFGIKSHGLPGGNTLGTTEVVNGQPVATQDSFRAYASPADSVNGYADFILNNKRYAPVRAAQGLEAQAAALGQSGYATDPNYGQKILQIAQSLPGGAPAAPIGPNDASPLDTAQYPAGPVGAPVDGVDPAALPATAQAAQGTLPTAQAVQAATQPARPAINPAIIAAMTNRYIDPQTKAVATMLFKSQMDAQAKASDPMRALQMQKLQADIDKTKGKAGTTEYGLNPIYGTDESGNPVLGTMGKDGTFKKVDTSGVKISTGVDKIDLGTQFAIYDKKSGQLIGYQPKNLRGAESEKVIGKAEGTAKSTLSSDLNNSEQTIKQLDDLIKHPGLSTIAGPIDQFRPSYTMGAEGRDALARYNQLKGKAFLQAYTTLRGGGQITEIEGTKAENAMARMDRAQSETDFKQALTDFRDAVKTGMDKMREKAGGTATGNKTSSGVSWSIQ